jgi:hypothetical protein
VREEYTVSYEKGEASEGVSVEASSAQVSGMPSHLLSIHSLYFRETNMFHCLQTSLLVPQPRQLSARSTST